MDLAHAAAIAEDSSVLVSGITYGSLVGPASGEGGDFAAVSLDAEGQALWSWQVIRAGTLE